jgi:catechol 2,3-dioxygenase-like lactoylglutathione lyase family enzyme
MSPNKPVFNRVDTVILRVRDLGKAVEWYHERLGLEPIHTDPEEGLSVLALGDTSVTLWQLKDGEEPPAPEAAGTFPIFGVPDAKAARSELKRRGVDVGPLNKGGGVRFFTFRDPDGNRLEVCEVLT